MLPAVQEINFSVGVLWELRIFQGKRGLDNNCSGKHSGGKGQYREVFQYFTTRVTLLVCLAENNLFIIFFFFLEPLFIL